MFKKIVALVLLISAGNVSGENFRKIEYQKLSNGIPVLFLESNWTEDCYVTICLSVGLSDDTSRKSEILGNIFKKKIEKDFNNKDSTGYNVEMASFFGKEQSLLSFYGKQIDLPYQLECIAKHFYNLEVSEEELQKEKKRIENNIKNKMVSDKNKVRAEALQSLYWHSNLGTPFSVEKLNSVTLDNLNKFHKANFTTNRISFVISGKLKEKNKVIKAIEEKFSDKRKSEINRLLEPSHHESTTRFETDSSQIKFPFIELYWRLPNYKGLKSVYDSEESFRTISPFALEIFLNYLNTELKKSLIDELKVAMDVSFDYSLWNYDEGYLRISIILKSKTYSREIELEILNEIKRLAYEINKQKLIQAQKEVIKSANVLTYQTDIIDTMNWFSEKIGVGYDCEFLRNYRKSVQDFNLEDVRKEVIKFFKIDPEVVSVLTPKEKEK